MRAIIISIFLATILVGCSSEDSSMKEQGSSMDTSRTHDGTLSDSARIITLPTPMQIPSLLRNTKAAYDRSVLLPVERKSRSFFKSNVLFGMHMIDLAYSSSYSDRSTAMEHFNECRDLASEMHLKTDIEATFYQRFERNIDRPDSLGRIILEFYDRGHHLAQTNENEGIGLVMVMGCLFEGLHLAIHQAKKHDILLYYHLLNQQKLYTSNLIFAFSQYEVPSEISREYELLLASHELLNQLATPSMYDLKNGNVEVSSVDPNLLRELERVCAEFRQSAQI